MRAASTPRLALCVNTILAPLLLVALGGACFDMGRGTGEAWSGPPFSADMYDLHNTSKPPTHVAIGSGKIRLQATDNGKTMAFVFDPQKRTAMVIDDQAKTYIDAGMFAPMVSVGMAPLLRMFRPAANGDPCVTWNGSVDQLSTFIKGSGPKPQFSCTPAGTDVVDGRPSHKWTVVATGGNTPSQQSTVWIDDRLHVLSKSTDANSSAEMRNIKEGEPPSDLFIPPAGYQKIGVTDLLKNLGNASGSSK
jgi:hypothetical protein